MSGRGDNDSALAMAYRVHAAALYLIGSGHPAFAEMGQQLLYWLAADGRPSLEGLLGMKPGPGELHWSTVARQQSLCYHSRLFGGNGTSRLRHG